MKPTIEQQHFVDTSARCAKLIAWAGTGKTSTLIARAKAVPQRTLYLAFNKSVADEAKTRFPSSVTCKTQHALAYGAILGRTAKYTLGRLSIFKTAKYFKIDYYLASLVHKTLEFWANSADSTLDLSHAAPDVIGRYNEDMRPVEVDMAKKVWELIQRGGNPDFPMTHFAYLKLYQLSKPRLGYDLIMLDEAQDTNPVTQDIVMSQIKHGTNVFLAGDPYQQIYCQPSGTMVCTVVRSGNGKTGNTKYQHVPIEDVKVGDRLAGYNIQNGYASKTGDNVTRVGKRNFAGMLVTVASGDFESRYTYDHHCIVRIANAFKGKHIVYIMRRGNSYRLGRTTWRNYSQHGQVGCLFRARQEMADAWWIVSVEDTKEDAAYQELCISWKFGIPTSTFQASKNHIIGQDGLDRFWKEIGDNSVSAERLLNGVGKDIRYPLWTKHTGNLLIRRPIVTAAINVETGMEVMLEDKVTSSNGKRLAKSAWSKIDRVSCDYRVVTVYSLEVEGSHTYFADGILTHNCWRGAVDALQKIDVAPYYLTQSFRFGPEVAGVANTLLRTFFNEQRPLVGLGQPGHILEAEEKMPTTPYTYLSRTNAFLFAYACGLAGKFKLYTPGSGNTGNLPLFDSTMNVYHLWKGNKFEIRDPELKLFQDYWEFSEFCDTGSADAEYMVSRTIVDKYKDSVPQKIEEVRRSLVPTQDQADIILVTAHRAKGLEWDNVILCDDFPALFDEETGALKPIGIENRDKQIAPDEINLLYVAATRAKKNLKPNSELSQLLSTAK